MCSLELYIGVATSHQHRVPDSIYLYGLALLYSNPGGLSFGPKMSITGGDTSASKNRSPNAAAMLGLHAPALPAGGAVATCGGATRPGAPAAVRGHSSRARVGARHSSRSAAVTTRSRRFTARGLPSGVCLPVWPGAGRGSPGVRLCGAPQATPPPEEWRDRAAGVQTGASSSYPLSRAPGPGLLGLGCATHLRVAGRACGHAPEAA